ncbi:VQ motif-containing protein 10-like isoform X2 [Phoenix dactylifera]|uniref:VQ motif-containing protein 10-like isoform X2 n=1 Tax=Phoenix dactylifera TaxID=42345 RepID=A0A8B8ZMM8_PHODC|nr:VQ motif-containing protein 10-like isoform X2 [Phoenix dactylifera]
MSSEGTKVRIIETQFVETDASHFKSIVQSLTGKDSTTVAAKASEDPSGSGRKTGRAQESIGPAGGGRERGNDPAPATRVQEREPMGAPTLDELRESHLMSKL